MQRYSEKINLMFAEEVNDQIFSPSGIVSLLATQILGMHLLRAILQTKVLNNRLAFLLHLKADMECLEKLLP